MQNNRILVIGLVWPEPGSSAAGSRMIQLVQLFKEYQYEVTFASAASKSDFSFDLPAIGVNEQPILLNDQSFDLLLKDLNPVIVMFDRYMVEEQYGWRVTASCPDALKMLDTEDLHCLRHARYQSLKKTAEPTNYFNDIAKREIAAILRCDVSLIISEVEMEILQNRYQVKPELLYYLPLLEDTLTPEKIAAWRPYAQREGLMFIGNYLHEPNWHTLQVIKTQVWPLLRKLLPQVNMHVYGAYGSQKVQQMHNEKERFLVHGRALNARDSMSTHKILLAPIQFGAGVKGKFIDAMQSGTPTVTTSIGSEAMNGKLPWNGIIEDDIAAIAVKAAAIYQNHDDWQQAATAGIRLINERYAKAVFAPDFIRHMQQIILHLAEHREQNFIGQILQHHMLNSLKYMSLWIQEKNKTI
jgi:glycosyltransferase involved in cell wall biosynthesis